MKTPEEIATQICIENGWPVRTAGALTEGYCMARNAACLAQRELAQKVKELREQGKGQEISALLAELTKEGQ